MSAQAERNHRCKNIFYCFTSALRTFACNFNFWNYGLKIGILINQNTFSQRFALEFPATGGIRVDTRFRTVKLIQYVNSWDYFILGCGIIHVAFIVYYCIEEFLEILKTGLSYFFGIWNIMDIVVLTVGFFHIKCIAFL